MNNLQGHNIEYLLNQIEDDDFGIELCLQHITGQELLKKPRRWSPTKDPAVRKLSLTTAIFATLNSIYVVIFPTITQTLLSIAATTSVFLIGCLVYSFIVQRHFVAALGVASMAFAYLGVSFLLPAYSLGGITPIAAIVVLLTGSVAFSTSTVGAVYALSRFSLVKANA